MIKRKLILNAATLIIFVPVLSLHAQEPVIKREITLYNPYKPSLPDVNKKSFLPDMTDTAKVKPDIKYDIKTYPYTPPYIISPIKAATMVPEPLNKLYNSYINFGLGNYLTPLAEVSITSLRSKQGNIGFYAGHFSTNGKVKLDNNKKAFAGFMDNNVSLYGRKFLRASILNGSVDFGQKTRYAYGYNPAITFYEPLKKDIRLNYYSGEAITSVSSMNPDSSELAYDFNLGYNIYFSKKDFFQHNIIFTGSAAKEIKGFYASLGIEFDFYKPSNVISAKSGYIASLTPSLKKKTADWNVKLGAKLLLDRFFKDDNAKFLIYPDLRFGFNIIPSYLNFVVELSGKMEKNTPDNIVLLNPYLVYDSIFRVRNTSYPIIVMAGLEGETGAEGRYRISASYSIVDNYLLFSNYGSSLNMYIVEKGNYFITLLDEAEILNFRGEIAGRIDRHFTFEAEADYFKYTLTNNEYAWGKPDWYSEFNLKYNLRDKIIAGLGVTATGKRRFLTTFENLSTHAVFKGIFEMPAHLNFNFTAEYRYTKILSFWMKFNNISFSDYFEWAWYPSLRFICMAGFTYSL
ncbi:MAG: hypothetical protein ACUVTX_02120 [Bacteroidales bacterium]